MKKVAFISKVNDIIKEWNGEFTNYPLSKRLIIEKLINHKDTIENYALINEEDEYVASIVLKKCLQGDVLTAYISFIYVNRKYRKQGIGTKMVNDALVKFKSLNLTRVWLGCDYGCLYSGLFVDNNEESHKFFLHRGFVFDHNTHNLILSKKINATRNLDNSFKYQLLTEGLREEFLEFVISNFSRRWYNENIDVDCDDVVLILKDNKIVAFARICMKESKILTNGINNYVKYENEGKILGALGPLGVSKELRKIGLGREIVLYGVQELFERGATDVLVDWTSLVDFYKKVCFEEICDVYSQYRYELI